MACREDEVRDRIKIDPTIAKAFWNEAKGYFDSGKDFTATIKAMADKAGLQEATVARVLTADKRLKAITNDMWLKRARYSEMTRAAQDVVDKADTPTWVSGAGKVWDAARQAAVIGHGGVFPFTHARNLLYSGSPTEMKLFTEGVKRAYSYMTSNAGKARWAEDMAKMQLRPEYTTWKRLGLDVDVGSEPVGILSSGAKGWGKRGFDALKPTRLDLAEHLSKQLPDDLKTEETGRMLAREVNYATGSVDLGKATQTVGKFMFAPKLWFAKRMEAFQPLRYLTNAGKMTPAQRGVANIALRRWAKIVGVTAGLLEANDAFNKYVLKNDKRVNFTDFSKPGTLWRMNVNGVIVPMSPLVEVVRTPVAFIGALMARKRDLKGDAPLTSASRLVLKDLLNSLHPSITTGAELISGREVFGTPGHLRRLPFPGVAQLKRGEEPEKEPPISWGEYLAEKGPIPISAGTREFVQALRDEGASPAQADIWVKSLFHSALSGGAGVHTFQEPPPKPVKTKASGGDFSKGSAAVPK